MLLMHCSGRHLQVKLVISARINKQNKKSEIFKALFFFYNV